MKSYTALRNLYGTLTKDASSANLTVGDENINDGTRIIATSRGGKWQWLEDTFDVVQTASQAYVTIPNKVRKIMDLYVTVGTTIYQPIPIEDPMKWKRVLASRLGESDVPMFYYRQGGRLYFAPTPASANTVTFRARINIFDLNQADYTTGTITSIANGATTVIGSGTTWTAGMAGSFIRITSTAAAAGGDGLWYEIASVTDATTLELLKPYQGTTLAAASPAYTIGQMSAIPESYDTAPVYRAVAIYWDKQGETKRASTYWRQYDGGVEAGLSQRYGGILGAMIQENEEKTEGAYLPPLDDVILERSDPNYPPRDLSGF